MAFGAEINSRYILIGADFEITMSPAGLRSGISPSTMPRLVSIVCGTGVGPIKA